MALHLFDKPLELATLLDETDSPDCGALVVFAGTVRRHNDGQPVTGLSYSAYEPLAEKALDDIEQDTLARFEVSSCRIHHRLGDLKIGDMSVLVVVRAAHRADAFAAARHAIDTLKQTVPIWKREAYADGRQTYLEGNALHGNDRGTSNE